MTHSFHDALPGYHPDQILHDGCDECEGRSRDVGVALRHLDDESFVRAWRRAAVWATEGDDTISEAEVPLLGALWAVRIKLQRLDMLREEEPR